MAYSKREAGDKPMDDEELGLPKPERYDGETFDVNDYKRGEYASAQTVEEAIEIRGRKAFLRDVTPDDFAEGTDPGVEKLGIAELWAQSTWVDGKTERDVDLEKEVVAVQKGDFFAVLPCPEEESDYGYAFYRADGHPLPYTPYHDYDDQLFCRELDSLRWNERLVCRVRDVARCYGGNGVAHDPDFCWRVYSCKVTVYRVTL